MMKEKLKTLFLADWNPLEKGLLLADVLLLGVLIGWITSPLKNGFGFFSNNSWNVKSYENKEEDEQ